MLQLHRPLQLFTRFGTFRRKNHFTDPALIGSALTQIQRTCAEERFALIAYCFMPDHVHLALEGRADDSDLRRCVKLARQRVAYVARRQFAIPAVWQSGYYERVVRAHGMPNVVRYILENPVQAGLVQHREDYPFSKSFLGREE